MVSVEVFYISLLVIGVMTFFLVMSNREKSRLMQIKTLLENKVNMMESVVESKDDIINILKMELTFDPLTTLYQRTPFEAELDRLLYKLPQEGLELDQRAIASSLQNVGLLFIDVDYFKTINDQYGHAVGDAVLREVALTIRDQANRKGDMVCRWGGEEFVVALPDTEKASVLQIAERIRAAVSKLDLSGSYPNLDTNVTVSIGISFTEFNIPKKELVGLADKAMYVAKKNGRNQVVLADEMCKHH